MGAVNFFGEAVFHQLGNHAGVIDMGMGEQHGIEAGRIEGKFAVVQFPFGF